MKSFLVATLMFFSLVANAADEYRGMLVAPGTVGQKDTTFFIDLKYEVDSDGKLSGEFKSWQSGPCRGERTIKGKVVQDQIEFVTDRHELQGCGRNRFIGRIEGDSLIGHMNFNGSMREISFKKK